MIEWALGGLSAIGGIMGAMGQSRSARNQYEAQAAQARAQAKAAYQASKYNQAVAKQQAKMIEQSRAYTNALYALEQTVTRQQWSMDSAAVRNQAIRVRGAQEAAFAANGVTMSGSAKDVTRDTATQMELEAMNVGYKGELDVWESKSKQAIDDYNMRVQAWQAKSQAKLYGMQAKSALSGMNQPAYQGDSMGLFGSILGSVAGAGASIAGSMASASSANLMRAQASAPYAGGFSRSGMTGWTPMAARVY